jgi:transposase
MEVLYRTCCGLDVHKQTVVACLLSSQPKQPDDGSQARSQKDVREFATTTEGLLGLAAWLSEQGCTHVAMEATGVYWKPIYNALTLSGRFDAVLVANAAHIKQVPGRKTDVKDAEWIADLLQHGLLRASFIPDSAQRELRDLTRTRTVLTDQRSAAVNRLQKVLEDAGLKLASSKLVTNIMGVSGRLMLEAILEGSASPSEIADLAIGKLRKKRAELEKALEGVVKPHHRLLIAMYLEQIDLFDEQIADLSQEVALRLRPFEQELARLDGIPGVGRQTAEVLAAEVGFDLSPFPSAAHLASWAGMCPGNNESAGKRKGGRTRKGSKWLRRALVQAAHAAALKNGSCLQAQYRRLKYRRGAGKAALAVGHSILVIAYHLLTRKADYEDLGPNHLDERRRARAERRAIETLESLGLEVTVRPKQLAA